MKKHSVKRNIEILLVVSSIISMIIISISVFAYINNILIENKKKEIYITALEQTHEAEVRFENNKLFNHMLSTRTRVQEFLLDKKNENRRIELNNIFSLYAKENLNYLAIYLLDKNGTCLISSDPSFVGADYSFRDYFKESINGKTFTDFALGKTSHQLGYYFSEPVFSRDGDVLGVMILKIDEKEVNAELNSSPLAADSVVMLVGESGVIVSSTEKDRRLKSLGTLSDEEKHKIKESQKYLETEIIPLQYDMIHEQIVNYKNPVITKIYDPEDGDDEIITLIKINNTPFYLVVESRLNLLNIQVRNTVLTVISIILIIFILMSLFIFKFIHYFIKPIDTIILYFKEITKSNDLSKKLEIKTSDEFEEMAGVINLMIDKLKNSYSALNDEVKKRTEELEVEKGSLETKVKERTVELENLKNNLETNVVERTEKLNEKLRELEQINKIMVGRELEMIKLKDELKQIKKV